MFIALISSFLILIEVFPICLLTTYISTFVKSLFIGGIVFTLKQNLKNSQKQEMKLETRNQAVGPEIISPKLISLPPQTHRVLTHHGGCWV